MHKALLDLWILCRHMDTMSTQLETSCHGLIYLPENACPSKVDAVKSYNGVEIVFYGRDCADTEIYAKQKAEEQVMIWIAPYNDIDAIAGQGTVGES